MAQYAAAIDQGTTSTRFMVFDHGGQVVSVDQKEHEQIYPKPGWVEHDANEIWQRTQEMVSAGVGKTQASDIAAVGVTNQRETTVVWDRTTGEPVHNAIVWQDTRTDQICNELSDSGPRPASPSPRTSRVRRSSGSSTTSTASESGPRAAMSCSETSTPGSSGS